MNSLMESNYCVAEPEYGQNFWKAMQGQIVLLDKLNGPSACKISRQDHQSHC